MEPSKYQPWSSWCRLCANEQNDNSINIHDKGYVALNEILEKYFLDHTSLEDMPQVLCQYCYRLVITIIKFNQRVEKVQQMYEFLINEQSYDLKDIRRKFGVAEKDRNWFDQISIVAHSIADYGNNIKEEPENQCISEASLERFIESPKSNSMYSGGIAYNERGKGDPFDFEHDNGCSDSGEPCVDHTDEDIVSLGNDEPKNNNQRKRKNHKDKICKRKEIVLIDFVLDGNCKECGESLQSYSICCQHMKQEHGTKNENKQWKCPVQSCDRTLQSWYNFERHIRIHMPVEKRRTIKCNECDSRFSSKAQLEAHINFKHKNDKNFVCEECGLCLRTNSNLRQHLLTHTDLKPYECEVCNKKFKNNSRLRIHMDTHSPNKHICPKCGLQLNSRATLNRHFLVHDDRMKHNCDYCGRAFKRAKALKNHLLLHTGLKPYSCEFCDRTFANGSNCRSHMKKMHPEELAQLEATGNKMPATNIPKLETLKAVTKAVDNLTPVVTKFSGCFAFGRKPKLYSESKMSKPSNNFQKSKKGNKTSDSQITSQADKSKPPFSSIEIDAEAAIPNFDNIYQHLLMKQHNMASDEVHIKRPPLSLSHSSSPNSSALSASHSSYVNEEMAQ
ncbi:zinc finger protein weckle [Haematobia irritans]|uniref:zinc finger protein weckle n=1 Tax=Haematobia irritans TaxID=7368 RepID=UPI003F4F4423